MSATAGDNSGIAVTTSGFVSVGNSVTCKIQDCTYTVRGDEQVAFTN